MIKELINYFKLEDTMQPFEIIFDKFKFISAKSFEYLPIAIIALTLIFLTYFMQKLWVKVVSRGFEKIGLRSTLKELAKKLISVGIWSIGIIIVCPLLFPSVTFGHLFTALGLSTVAIGFALKDVFENFIAGIMILARETFTINDLIACNNFEGRVEKITIRDTHIRRSDGHRVIIPNAILYKNPVKVSSPVEQYRITLSCTISYENAVETVKNAIEKAIKKTPHLCDKNKTNVYAQNFSSGAIDYQIEIWLSKSIPQNQCIHSLICQIQSALKAAHITIMQPYFSISPPHIR
jgi:small-conductance mechanosensitive channel